MIALQPTHSVGRLDTASRLVVRQKREMGEILTGFQLRNRYEIGDGVGAPFLFAGEVSEGVGAFFLRQFFGRRRPFTVDVRDDQGTLALRVRRPWRWWLSRAEIEDGSGQRIGAVQQRFAFFQRRYTIEDQHGRELAEFHGPFFCPWTFEIRQRTSILGKITKRWSGLLQEAFTQADNFALELSPQVDPSLRMICLGATFLIDFVHFERK